jgi:hypothetical protein
VFQHHGSRESFPALVFLNKRGKERKHTKSIKQGHTATAPVTIGYLVTVGVVTQIIN